MRVKSIEMREHSDKALLIGVGCNLFEWGSFLRRMDQFLVDLYLNPSGVHRLLDELLNLHLGLLSKVCNAVGDIVDIIKFGDDLGTNNGPLIPPEVYD